MSLLEQNNMEVSSNKQVFSENLPSFNYHDIILQHQLITRTTLGEKEQTASGVSPWQLQKEKGTGTAQIGKIPCLMDEFILRTIAFSSLKSHPDHPSLNPRRSPLKPAAAESQLPLKV